ncbi:MAG TPA: hypothetical protein VKS21_08970 [Spirochaetota bacterium]|nr:hypothetical protein [Spirochaetota bacterium]
MKNKFLKNILKTLMIAVMAMIVSCGDDDNGGNEPVSLITEVTSPSTLAAGDTLGSSKPATIYKADVSVTGDVTLAGKIYIDDGATLSIDPGVTLTAASTDGDLDVLIIKQGGQIDAQGTAADPIVFTSGGTVGQRSPQDWGGIQILGYAPGKGGATGSTAEGLGDTHGIAGGTDDADSSGTMRYVIIQFAGKIYNENNELNGLGLFGVGSGTTIDFVQTHRCSDDGFEPFGGSVALKNVVGSANEDDQLDCAGPWLGYVSNALAICCNDGGSAVEYDGDEGETGTGTSQTGVTNLVISSHSAGDYATLWREDGVFNVNGGTWYVTNSHSVIHMQNDDSDGIGASLDLRDVTVYYTAENTFSISSNGNTLTYSGTTSSNEGALPADTAWETAADLAAAAVAGTSIGAIDAGFDISWCLWPAD